MKKNATRKALFSSVLALVLCFSMLMGTTFAWFTDSAASANNIIQPGNLDVKLEYWDGDSYEEVAPTQKLFDEAALWEPGHVEVAYLKVSNAGSLALKYQLNVNVFKETVGKTMAGADLKLSDHLVFSVIDKEITSADDVYSREAAMLAAGNAKGLKAYNGETKSLAVNGSDYVALVIYMPTNVGNEANHDGINLPSIEMGVNVMATQFTYEEDSFGPDYDQDAIYTDAIVTNEEELKEALANAKNGAVIGIKGNVTWTTGAGIGSTPFVASVTRAATAKNITLLGLEEGATFTATGAGVGAIGIDDGTVTFKNLKIADESVSYAEGSWEYGYLEFRGNTVFENCDIVNAIMMDGDSAKFVNCSFNSNKTKEYAVWVSNGTASFENCYFTGFRGLKTHEAYGSEVASITVNNCKFVDITEKPGMAIGTVNATTEIKLTNNEFIGTQAGDQGLYIYETDTDVTTFKFVSENNKVVSALASGNDELRNAITAGETNIALSAGNYSLPTMTNKEGVTIEGVEGAVIGGESASSGFSGNFGKNNTYKNLTFTGSNNGVRSSYGNGGPVTFENCTFAGSTYGFHMDKSYGGTLTFNNCTFIGFNAFASDLVKVTFNNCTFLHNGNYGHTNIWSVGEFNNCTFGDKATFGIRGSGKIFVDGVRVVYSADELSAAVSAGETTIKLANGEYDLNGIQKNGLKLIGIGNDVKVANTTRYANGKAVGAITKAINLENMTITNTVYTMEDGGNATFTGVYFAAGMRQCYGTGVVFTDCTFGSNSEGYALHFQTDSVSEGGLIKLDGCTFEGGKVHLGGKRAYEFTGCDFAAGTDFQVWSNISLKDCTVNGETVTAENMATLFPNLNAEKVTIK